MENTSKVRTAFLNAAEKLFSQYGYEKTSVDQIARLANRAKTSLYYHFDSKLTIFKSCLVQEFQTLMARMTAIREEHQDSEAACLAAYLRARIEILPQMPVYRSYVNNLTLNLAGGELKETVDAVRESFDRYEYNYFFATAQKGLNAGVFPDKISPDAFARMLIVILRGLEIQFFMTEDLSTMRATYEALIELLLQNFYAGHPKN
ncbi:MAG: TetR/AcrR family transcriptional regulator [Bacteroidales bacterium]|nr:TetR/AcrR family transcriptional regulator [Bacteroidales bacterium]